MVLAASVKIVDKLPGLEQPTQSGPRTFYGIGVGYDFDLGLVGLPVAGPARSPSKVLRLHGGMCYKVVRWIAQRVAEKPELPHWDTGSPNEVLMKKTVSSNVPTCLVDATTIWTRFGEYVYLLLTPPADTDMLASAAPPWSTIPAPLCAIKPEEFLRNILAPVPPVSGAVPGGKIV